MILFPEKIKGKYVALLSIDTDRPPATKIGIAFFDKEKDIWSPEFWDDWYQSADNNLLRLPKNEFDHFEVGAPPIKTKEGWLFIPTSEIITILKKRLYLKCMLHYWIKMTHLKLLMLARPLCLCQKKNMNFMGKCLT